MLESPKVRSISFNPTGGQPRMNVAAAVYLVVIEGASIGTPSAVMEVAVGHGEPLSIPCFARMLSMLMSWACDEAMVF